VVEKQASEGLAEQLQLMFCLQHLHYQLESALSVWARGMGVVALQVVVVVVLHLL
jgi:hypothetical protein